MKHYKSINIKHYNNDFTKNRAIYMDTCPSKFPSTITYHRQLLHIMLVIPILGLTKGEEPLLTTTPHP